MQHWLTRNWFLLGLLGAVGLAFALPGPGGPGGWLHAEWTTKLAVAVIFFVQGLVLPLAAMRRGLASWRLHVLVQGFGYLMIPLVALALDQVAGPALPGELRDLRLGFLFLAVLPTTISSAVVFTALAGGNTAGALVNTTLSNVLGVFLTPLWAGVLLRARGEVLPLGDLMQEIALLVVAPLVLGQGLRPLVPVWADRNRAAAARGNSLVVLFIVYTAFCSSVQSGVWTQHGWASAGVALTAAAVLFAIVLGLTAGAVRLFGLGPEDRIAALFCAPQKTLAAGAPMAKLIFAANPALGLILLPVMFYHPLQLLVSGMLVNAWRRRRG